MIESETNVAAQEPARGAALGRIAASLRGQGERAGMLALVVRDVCGALDAAGCAILALDPADPEFAFVLAAAEMTGVRPSSTRERVAGTWFARALTDGDVLRFDTFDGTVPDASGARAAVAVPLTLDDGAAACLVATFATPRAFDEAELVFVRGVAALVEFAFARGELLVEEIERRKRAESLERTMLALRDARQSSDVLAVVARELGRELHRPCAAYVLAAGVPRFVAGDQTTPPLDASALSLDVPQDGVPVRAGGRDVVAIGDGAATALFVLGEGARLRDDEFKYVRSVAAHAALALGSARAFEQLRRYAAEGAAINEAARTILGFTEVGALAEALCRLALSLVGADQASLYEKRAGALALVGSASDRGVATERATLPIDGSGDASRHMVSHTLPLGTNESTERGALLVLSRERAPFDRSELRLLDALATLAALAMRNVELYEAAGRANDALEESNAFKDDLMAMFAHDFRGPLTVISGFAELLLETDSSDVRSCAQTMIEQTRRLTKLSEDALALAATQSAGFSLQRRYHDLVAFVRDAVRPLDPDGTRVRLVAPAHPIPLLFDPGRLRHAVDNVVGNALKYSIQEVRVALVLESGHVAIEITDRGIGIPAADLPKVFTRFGRGHNARVRGIAGSGVGLYIARKIVEVHGGSLSVDSVENQGSTFTLRLPLDADVRPPGSVEGGAPPATLEAAPELNDGRGEEERRGFAPRAPN